MTRYHINFEGKVYPCRAKVLKCPYSESLHSNDKIELYYKVMGSKKDEVEPSVEGMNEVRKLNRLKSLYSLSNELEQTDSPVELITYTLKSALGKLVRHDLEEDHERWNSFEDDMAEDVYDVLNSGFKVPINVPAHIARKGEELFSYRRRGVPQEYARSTRNQGKLRKRRRLADRDFGRYNHYKKWQLNKDNYEGTYNWMANDFEKFSHDLNTSRMITQPIFYGNLEKSKEQIRQMDDYELLAAFDDYSVTDKEIEENVKEANFFKFKKRKDLSDKANGKLKEWYDRNRKIYRNWKVNTPKRVLLSMEIAEELDRRDVYRQEGSIAKMFEESEGDLK